MSRFRQSLAKCGSLQLKQKMPARGERGSTPQSATRVDVASGKVVVCELNRVLAVVPSSLRLDLVALTEIKWLKPTGVVSSTLRAYLGFRCWWLIYLALLLGTEPALKRAIAVHSVERMEAFSGPLRQLQLDCQRVSTDHLWRRFKSRNARPNACLARKFIEVTPPP